ncbi:hypothetical protein M899_1946 [Bacteriovorax sp. BSW11_IV]|uniref:hypothetical protein n=1 Tax=Bacteriovorax sp. BSW11_IV TaxID=1353529 RepID=UPI00038A2A93|nr:hypothetical protein [Bacteriovorax sp. BSW11_IV]EQC48495.1 hypothetical protein M899_1946 [Bacteriovorax sp. BSW11_IV]
MKLLKLSLIIGLLTGAFFSFGSDLEDDLDNIESQMESVVQKAQTQYGQDENKESARPTQSLKETVRMALGPFRKMSDEELHRHVEDSLKRSGTGALIKKYPQTIDVVSELLKDPEALPSLSGVVERRDRLWFFVGINIGIIFFGIALRKLTSKDGDGLVARARKGLIRFFFLNVLRIATFVYFFYDELMPAWYIVKDTLKL